MLHVVEAVVVAEDPAAAIVFAAQTAGQAASCDAELPLHRYAAPFLIPNDT